MIWRQAGMEVQLHAFLTSALNGDERPASRTIHFIPGYEIDRGEVGLKGVLDAVKNNRTSVPATNPTPLPRLTCRWFLSYYTDWAIRAVREILLSFLGASAEMRKTIISFVMSASPPARSSVCPHGTTLLPIDDFHEILHFEYFSKICKENSSFIKILQE